MPCRELIRVIEVSRSNAASREEIDHVETLDGARGGLRVDDRHRRRAGSSSPWLARAPVDRAIVRGPDPAGSRALAIAGPADPRRRGEERQCPRALRAGHLQRPELRIPGLLHRNPAEPSRNPLTSGPHPSCLTAGEPARRRRHPFAARATGDTASGDPGSVTAKSTARRWSSRARKNASPASASLNFQSLFFTPSKMSE